MNESYRKAFEEWAGARKQFDLRKAGDGEYTARGEYGDWGTGYAWMGWREGARLVERLVAQECIGICKDQACGGSAFNNAAEHIALAIRRRFGLEA